MWISLPHPSPRRTDALNFNGTIVDSEFGGRHMDVVLTIGETRVQSRIPAGERGSWARTLEPGQAVVASIKQRSVKFFDDAGKLLPWPRAPSAVGG